MLMRVAWLFKFLAIIARIQQHIFYLLSGHIVCHYSQDIIVVVKINVPLQYIGMYVQRRFYIADPVYIGEVGFKNKYFHKRCLSVMFLAIPAY